MTIHLHEPIARDDKGQIVSRYRSARLILSIMFIQFVVMTAQILVYIILSHSITLLSDALHMFTHLIAMIGSFIATTYAIKKEPTFEATFKYWRLEILVAFINAIILFPLIGYVVYESVLRFLNKSNFDFSSTLIIGCVGLIGNIICAIIAYASSKHNTNIKSIYIHMLSDGLTSIGVIFAALISYFVGISWIDPVIASVISVFLIYWGVSLFKESAIILLEIAPKHLNVSEIQQSLQQLDFVKKIHDFHIWTITDDLYALTCHIVIDGAITIAKADDLTKQINKLLKDKYNINHSCIQFEKESATSFA
ncbi:MAG: cation transporter [Planctomycetes bacterium]|nr:cation transporter [Planctomycetota bacterium]